ncbi:MAG TPA: tetratricopeptide repeat protein [Streptosporangiaceae bacterium]|nr:tetratricopeptide repeat protein [Streptosporangiaceae bacterium]
MAEPPVVTFAALLRQLRTQAGLSQEELAEASGLSTRAVSDLERGVAQTARKDTARLLADALDLAGPDRDWFEAVARGRTAALARTGAGIGGTAAATRALPRDIGSFTGRAAELDQLVTAVAAAGSGGVVGIHAIGGMAGIGKTALAVHAAYRLAPMFPDGQIFLPLHGHTPGQRPVDPSDALASLLQTAGVGPAQIPATLEARMALWRDRVADRQLLLLLDDASGSEQVRPLLPASPGSLVLVTSRRHLSALDDAQSISLDTLPPAEAADLLVRLAARPGLAAEDPAVGELTRLCGCLPLAVGMLGRQLHHHPAWSAADLAAELAATHDRLGLLRAENLSVDAALSLSYQDLADEQQQLFRRLGLHPGAEIDAYAAAALGGTSLAAAVRQLEALYDHYLIGEPARGRYRFHDLVREHARTLAAADPAADRDAATERVLGYYQHTATLAAAVLARQTRQMTDAAAATPPAAIPEVADRVRALAWARAERASLLAYLDQATSTGQHARVVAFTAALAALLRMDGPWAEAVTRHNTAASAARQLGDRLALASALQDLGDAQTLTGDVTAAAQALDEALGIYRAAGDRQGQANALYDIAKLRLLTCDYPGASRALQEALDIYRELGDYRGQASAFKDVGVVQLLTGDIPGGTESLAHAARIGRDSGDRPGEAAALCQLGYARLRGGNEEAAAESLNQARGIFRDLGDRLGQATTGLYLGYVWRTTDDYTAATQALDEAHSIFGELGDRRGQALALQELGAVRQEAGDLPGAEQALEQALGIFEEVAEHQCQAEALNDKGALHRAQGDLGRAETCHRTSLDLARQIGSPEVEASALAGLGRCALAAGRIADARASLTDALEIFQRIGAGEAPAIAAEIGALDGARQADHPRTT